MDQVTYNISYINAKYYVESIDNALVKTSNDLTYVFNRGYIYQKNGNSYFQELTRFKKLSLDMSNKYTIEKNISLPLKKLDDSNIYKYFFLDYLFSIQSSLVNITVDLSDQDLTIFFLINNIFPEFDNYLNSLIVLFNKQMKSTQNVTLRNVLIMKILEFIIVCIIIGIEWVFIFLGYEKSKKKW